jgi:hypothetical protein
MYSVEVVVKYVTKEHAIDKLETVYNLPSRIVWLAPGQLEQADLNLTLNRALFPKRFMS